jgi:glycosyltransferase involved in cell wall biosynthesis
VEEYQTVAILPYISGYNASYSAIFFVTLGIPVVATNLDIFLESQRNGAGMVLVDRTPDAFATAISTILNSSDTTRRLIEDDRKYCARYSIHNFCDFLIDESASVT